QSISSTGDASATETLVRQRSMFRGRRWSEREGEVSDGAEQAAYRFWNSVRQAMRSAANRLGAEMPEMIEGVFNVKTFFDKKGNIEEDKTEEWGEILGRRFDEDFEQFQKRVKGFNILNVIANQLTADQIGSAQWHEVFAPPEAPPGH